MEHRTRIFDELRVEPGTPANLAGRDSRWTGGGDLGLLTNDELDAAAKTVLARGVDDLTRAQELLWASDTQALLVVFQAMDAAGKDSTIKHVLSGVNPQGVDVVSFTKPSSEELDHTFLWRIWRAVPQRGRIGVFNRSHYEEVVAVRVHPERLGSQKLPAGERGPEFWAARFDDINAFERHLSRNGTTVLKFFLNVSRDEQRRRFVARLDNPDKNWKFTAADVIEPALWDRYFAAYEAAITATSTPWAPWYVVPADDKHVMQAMTVAVLTDVIAGLDLHWPTVSAADRDTNARARESLAAQQTNRQTADATTAPDGRGRGNHVRSS